MTLDYVERIGGILDTLFSHHARIKGVYYRDTGRVQSCELGSDPDGSMTIHGEVQGSEPLPYRVEVRFPADPPGAAPILQCSCPVGPHCKHTAAVLLEAVDPEFEDEDKFEVDTDEEQDAPVRRRASAATPQAATPQAAPALDAPLQTWLRQLDLTICPEKSAPEDHAYPPGETARLLYLLKPEQGHLELELTMVQLHPRGGYQFARKTRLANLLNADVPRGGLRPIDLLLARKIQAAALPATRDRTRLQGVAGAELLAGLLVTGRCHLQGYGKNHPALRLGEPRPAQPVWQVDAKGCQRPAFVLNPPEGEVLPLVPPWYVDEIAGTCGPLATGLPDATAYAWLHAPPVKPDQAELVARQLASRGDSVSLPSPHTIAFEDLRDLVPVPCLRLFSVKARSYYTSYYARRDLDSGLTEANLAQLTFEYPGWGRVPLSDGSSLVLQEFREGKLRRLHRAVVEEAEAEELLFDGEFTRAETHLYDLPSHVRDALTLEDAEDWLDFMQSEVPKLRALGWQIECDETFAFRLAEPESWYADADQLGGDSDWFGVELGIVLDGQKLNLLPILLQYFRANPRQLSSENLATLGDADTLPVRLPDGRTLGFPAKRLRDMLGVLLELLDADALTKRGRLKVRKLRAVELSGSAGDEGWRWLGKTELRQFHERLRSFSGIKSITPSSGLQTSLRPYQQEGLNWLQFLREYDLAGVLADDMGLGKTIQTLAHLQIEKESGRADRPSLVVAPTSLMTNWRQETERFAPNLRVLVLHGLDRKQHFDKLQQHDLIITSYPLLPRDQQFLLAQKFHYVILDEAQYIKNPKTIYAQIACQLQARHHLCLTGTPMENHLGELWSLFNFLLPGFLGDETRFNAAFRRPIERGKSDDRRKLLAHRVAPFLLRRRKEAVVKELPPKTEIVQNVALGQAQRDLYESIRLSMHQRVKEEVDKKGINRAHIIILDALLKLRQVCCDPRLLSLPSARQVQESAKLELLLDLLPGMIEEGRRILLFSQFTSMLALIEEALRKQKIHYVLLTGDTRDRATPITRFQQGHVPLFLISLKAGGTGLNLTAADTVIHYDPWWNPAVENQATDRAHRIGQDKSVFVYKLMTVGTVEEKIGALQARKRELVEGLLNEDRRDNLQLTADDLDVLFAPLH